MVVEEADFSASTDQRRVANLRLRSWARLGFRVVLSPTWGPILLLALLYRENTAFEL